MIGLVLISLAFAGKPKVVEAPPPPPPPVVVDPLATQPVIPAPPGFVPPTPSVQTLKNGVPVWLVEDHTLPIVSVMISVPGGSASDPAGKRGRATLSDQMMRQGAGDLDATAFAELVERQAITLDVRTSRTASAIAITCHRDQLDRALGLAADLILRPTYGGKDLKRERALEVAGLEQATNEPVAVAGILAWSTWWGEGTPLGNPPAGLAPELRKVKKKDVVAYHTAAWNAGGARITVAGDLSGADLTAKLEPHLGAWAAGAPIAAPTGAAPDHHGEILAVDRPGSSQTMIYAMFDGVAFAAEGSPDLRAASIVLGGSFTSRLNTLLREEKAYTYGVAARSVELPNDGVATITTRVRTDSTGAALADLVGALDKAQAGVTVAEVGKATGAWRQDLVEAMGTRDGTADTYAPWHAAGKSPSALAEALVAMGSVTKAQVDGAMATFAPKGDAIYVLVGDRKIIEPQLTAKGFSAITWIAD